jgi:hypothetical protein
MHVDRKKKIMQLNSRSKSSVIYLAISDDVHVHVYIFYQMDYACMIQLSLLSYMHANVLLPMHSAIDSLLPLARPPFSRFLFRRLFQLQFLSL